MSSQAISCPSCGHANCEEKIELEKFPYGDPVEIDLEVMVPVCRCPQCTFTWTDYRAEEIRDRAVSRLRARRGESVAFTEVIEIIKHLPYRTYQPSYEKCIFKIDYNMGDCISKLEVALAQRMGCVDNHHGWVVRTESGQVLLYYFSDWRFSIYLHG